LIKSSSGLGAVFLTDLFSVIKTHCIGAVE